MKESLPNQLAKLLQVVRGMEQDLGVDSLTKSEKSVFTAMADLSPKEGGAIDVNILMRHPDIKVLPLPTVYKCLRDLKDKNMIRRIGSSRSGIGEIA